MPDDKFEDLRPVYEVITAVARDFDELPIVPRGVVENESVVVMLDGG
jgi:hypothetical protein